MVIITILVDLVLVFKSRKSWIATHRFTWELRLPLATGNAPETLVL